MAVFDNCCMAEATAGAGMHDVVCNFCENVKPFFSNICTLNKMFSSVSIAMLTQ
jgi:hypothetical protein